MIDYIKIKDIEYPLQFSFRAVFGFMNSAGLETLEETEQEISLDYDALLDLFAEAIKCGVRKDDKFDKNPLSKQEIEDAIDDEPRLFMELQTKFNQSQVIKTFNQSDNADKKK